MKNILAQAVYDESSVALHALGELGIDKWGNKYRYVKAGASALVAGNLIQEPAEDTNFRSMNVATAAAIGATSIDVTLAGTAVTANQFDAGVLLTESATGLGQLFRITGHTVQTSTTGTCTFYLDRPLKVALVATTSQVTVRKNPYNGVIQYPTTSTGGAVGGALTALPAAYFGWVQSGGTGTVLFDTGSNTAADAGMVSPSQAVAGSVKVGAAATAQVGIAREVASVDSTQGVIHWTLD